MGTKNAETSLACLGQRQKPIGGSLYQGSTVRGCRDSIDLIQIMEFDTTRGA
jgi:hypothetical protein